IGPALCFGSAAGSTTAFAGAVAVGTFGPTLASLTGAASGAVVPDESCALATTSGASSISVPSASVGGSTTGTDETLASCIVAGSEGVVAGATSGSAGAWTGGCATEAL